MTIKHSVAHVAADCFVPYCNAVRSKVANCGNLKYSVHKICKLIHFCVCFTLICSKFCPVEGLITEHFINVAAVAR